MAVNKPFPKYALKVWIIIAILAIVFIVSFADAASLRKIDLKDIDQESADADTVNENSPFDWSDISLPLQQLPNRTNQSNSTSNLAVVGLKKGTVMDLSDVNLPDMTTLPDGNKIIQDLSQVDESIFEEIAKSDSDTQKGKPPKINIVGYDQEEGGCPFFDETVNIITSDPNKVIAYRMVFIELGISLSSVYTSQGFMGGNGEWLGGPERGLCYTLLGVCGDCDYKDTLPGFDKMTPLIDIKNQKMILNINDPDHSDVINMDLVCDTKHSTTNRGYVYGDSDNARWSGRFYLFYWVYDAKTAQEDF